MNEREEIAELAELATIINDSAVARGEGWVIFGEHAAEDVLTAGYRKPKPVTTAEELDALGRGTAVLDAHQRVWTNDGDTLDQWGCVHHDEYPVSLVWRGSADVALPATVLHEGTQP